MREKLMLIAIIDTDNNVIIRDSDSLRYRYSEEAQRTVYDTYAYEDFGDIYLADKEPGSIIYQVRLYIKDGLLVPTNNIEDWEITIREHEKTVKRVHPTERIIDDESSLGMELVKRMIKPKLDEWIEDHVVRGKSLDSVTIEDFKEDEVWKDESCYFVDSEIKSIDGIKNIRTIQSCTIGEIDNCIAIDNIDNSDITTLSSPREIAVIKNTKIDTLDGGIDISVIENSTINKIKGAVNIDYLRTTTVENISEFVKINQIVKCMIVSITGCELLDELDGTTIGGIEGRSTIGYMFDSHITGFVKAPVYIKDISHSDINIVEPGVIFRESFAVTIKDGEGLIYYRYPFDKMEVEEDE